MKIFRSIFFIIFILSCSLHTTSAAVLQKSLDTKDITSMSIEELMDVKVVSVSNFVETKKNAPGNVLYIEKSELIHRGYNDLVEIFNDLPGIDFAQTWGDLYYKTYWRGYRQGLSSPFLLMLDGKVINHLYYHWTDILVSIPISMVDHIEIVYGPTSAVYGANALMGVFNIITTKEKDENGSYVDAKFTIGNFDTKVSDVTVLTKTDDILVRASAFLNYGGLDQDKLEKYEYTKSKYVSDPKLWGDFLNAGFFPGEYNAYRENKGFGLSTIFSNVELGLQYYRVDSKYGVNYAYDNAPPGCSQIQDDYFVFFETKNKINQTLTSSTFVRYRKSDLPNTSATLEAVSGYGEQRMIKYGYWQLTNSSWSASQDFDINFSNFLYVKTGFNYEAQSLQKSYGFSWGDTVSPSNSENYNFPTPPENTARLENSSLWEYIGAHFQSKFDLGSIFDSNYDHYLSAGFRYDDISEFGSYWTYRLAYILNYKNYGFKLMYGTATQEPASRLLYGGWIGSNDNLNLVPEESKNLESVLFYSDHLFYISFNPYYSIVEDAIDYINSIPMNITEREMLGIDLHFTMKYVLSAELDLKLWSYFSYIHTSEERYNNDAEHIGNSKIGDIAPYKVYFGTNIGYNIFNLNLRARFISERDNYQSNPVPHTPEYFTLDLNLIAKNILKNVSLGLKVNNIFDKTYYHPGIRDANAGITPGYFDADDNWYGSRGWMNSLLPQPGRAVYLQLMLDIK